MTVHQIRLDKISDSRYQTRQHYPQAYIGELATDIRQVGLLQIPVGRMVGDLVELAFGHCRLRAFRYNQECDNIGLDIPRFGHMPVDIQNLTDEQMSDFMWSENKHRKGKLLPASSR